MKQKLKETFENQKLNKFLRENITATIMVFFLLGFVTGINAPDTGTLDVLQPKNLSEGLVLHYTFEEANVDRKVKDRSGNGNTGLIRGNPEFTSLEDEEAIKLDGKGDYIRINDFQLPSGNGTVVAEVYVSNLSRAGHIIYTGKGDGWGNQQEIHLSLANNEIRAYFGSVKVNEGQYDVRSRTEKEDLQFSMSYENGDPLKLYQDGEIRGKDSENGRVETDQWPETTFIGKPNADKRYFQGEIKEIRVYDRKLTGAELRAVKKDREIAYMALRNYRLNLFVVILLIAGLTVYRRREK